MWRRRAKRCATREERRRWHQRRARPALSSLAVSPFSPPRRSLPSRVRVRARSPRHAAHVRLSSRSKDSQTSLRRHGRPPSAAASSSLLALALPAKAGAAPEAMQSRSAAMRAPVAASEPTLGRSRATTSVSIAICPDSLTAGRAMRTRRQWRALLTLRCAVDHDTM